MTTHAESILLVDDDPDVQLLYTAHLEAAGYRVRSACDGTSCIVAVQRDRPDLVILDLGLPAGDGETALHNLRTKPELAKMPILILSGREASEWEARSLSLGANAYVQKPALPEHVLATVRGLLDGLGAPAAPAPLPRQVGTLHCPHCGHAVAGLNAELDPRAIDALARARLDG